MMHQFMILIFRKKYEMIRSKKKRMERSNVKSAKKIQKKISRKRNIASISNTGSNSNNQSKKKRKVSTEIIDLITDSDEGNDDKIIESKTKNKKNNNEKQECISTKSSKSVFDESNKTAASSPFPRKKHTKPIKTNKTHTETSAISNIDGKTIKNLANVNMKRKRKRIMNESKESSLDQLNKIAMPSPPPRFKYKQPTKARKASMAQQLPTKTHFVLMKPPRFRVLGCDEIIFMSSDELIKLNSNKTWLHPDLL